MDVANLKLAQQALGKLIQLVESGKVDDAIKQLPSVYQAETRQTIEGSFYPLREQIDNIFSRIASRTNLPEAKELYQDLVDEDG